jgi:hypothetical protein
VKRSDRDETMWIAIYNFIATLGISLYNYIYVKLAKKKVTPFLLSLMFSLQQNWRIRGQNTFCPESMGYGESWEVGWGRAGGGRRWPKQKKERKKEKISPHLC